MRITTFYLTSLLLLTACHEAPQQPSESAQNEQTTAETTSKPTGTQRMVKRLKLLAETIHPMQNSFMNSQRLNLLRALETAASPRDQFSIDFRLATELLRAGESQQAADQFAALMPRAEELAEQLPKSLPRWLRSLRAISLMRVGEQSNCVALHMSKSCLFPIDTEAMHVNQQGSRAAMDEYRVLLEQNPDDLTSRWLYNLAAQTVGDYPDQVPDQWLIPPDTFDSGHEIDPFINVAPQLGVNTISVAGSSITDDFNGDGYLDIMASSWSLDGQLRLFINQRDGQFSETTFQAGLKGLVGGLNIIQADYDNDGDLDVLVLRGAWLIQNGRHPNSLLRNDGNGHFEDVTEEAGLLSFHPTQAGAWGDFDNDGWLDLYIGNEARRGNRHLGELYRNNRDGTFTNVASEAGIAAGGFVKAVVWGDYNNDGWIDLYVSRMGNRNLLFQNQSMAGQPKFVEVARQAGVAEPQFSFPTWFWDFDNDGWLDIFVADFASNAYTPGRPLSFRESHAKAIAASYLGAEPETAPRLFRNNQNGTFSDVTQEMGLNKPLLAMGANFGDIDNDGHTDLYIGTGAPDFRSLVPNRMFRNSAGKGFQDVTTAGGFGHLQKGHGISFADLDNDGDQDVYAVMGGAYSGDFFQNALFENPGNENHWITLRLQGVTASRSAIGARIHVQAETPSGIRDIHAVVGSGGSFGASSLQQEIGLGDAIAIQSITIDWPGGTRQVLEDIAMDQILVIREGDDQPSVATIKKLAF